MDYQAGLIRVSALATQIRATAEVKGATGTVTQVRILAQTAIAALTAAINAPTIELSLKSQLINAAALTGQFLKVLNVNEAMTLSDQAVFSLARAFEDLAAIGDQAAIRYGKAASDAFVASDEQITKVIKGLTDTLGLTDSHVVVMGKVLDEPVGVSDPIAKVLHTARHDGFRFAEGPAIDDYALDYFLEDYGYDGKPQIRFIKGVADSAALSDASTRRVNKGLTETPVLTDTLTRFISRQITDNIQATDDFFGAASIDDDEVMAFFKGATDAFLVGDTFARVVFFTRQFNDSAALSDASTARIGKALSDNADLADAATIRSSKALADAAAISDATAKSLSKGFSDSSSVTDSATSSVNKGLSDAGELSDAAISRLGKALADAAALNDVKNFSLSRSVSDQAAITDTPAKSVNQTKTDSAALTDSGSIRMQGYCDISYFATDYVGVYTTF